MIKIAILSPFRKEGEKIGLVKGIDDQGLLIIDMDGEIKHFHDSQIKEISA